MEADKIKWRGKLVFISFVLMANDGNIIVKEVFLLVVW